MRTAPALTLPTSAVASALAGTRRSHRASGQASTKQPGRACGSWRSMMMRSHPQRKTRPQRGGVTTAPSVVAFVVAAMGCAVTNYQAYPGPVTARRDQVAVVVMGTWQCTVMGNCGLWATAIDGEPVKDYPRTVALLPGDHVLEVGGFASPTDRTRYTFSYTVKFHAEAGRSYRAFITDPSTRQFKFGEELK